MIGHLLALAVVALSACAPAPAQEGDAQFALGRRIFSEQGCYGCHTVGKVGTPIAVDLSRVGTKYPEEYLRRWLRDPSLQKPMAHMPRIDLSETEVRALAAYLDSLR